MARPILLHWDGAAWHRQRLPWSATEMGVYKVVATGQSSVWVVRQPSAQGTLPLERWDGSSWHAVPSPFGPHDPILGFSATSGSDAWAVGSYRLQGGGDELTHPLAAHWDGSAWRFTPVPSEAGHNVLVTDVAEARSGSAWAASESQQTGPNEAFEPLLVLLHWDGNSWTVAPGSPLSSYEASPTVAVGSHGTAWAVTNCGVENIVLGWNGTRWKAVPHPPDLRGRMPVRATGPMPSCAAPRG